MPNTFLSDFYPDTVDGAAQMARDEAEGMIDDERDLVASELGITRRSGRRRTYGYTQASTPFRPRLDAF